jgi:hypothetical protein
MSQMFLNVVSTFKGDGINQATRQLGAFGKQTKSLGSMLGKIGGALASFGLAAKSIEFGKEAITQARDLERNLFALNIIFGDLAPKMTQFTKNAEELGLSQSRAAKATTFIGSVLKQSGFEMDRVGIETEKLVKLGVDLAATYGYDVQEALLGMTALFRGEYDPIEKFGVAMKQAEINAVLAERGLNKLTGAELRNAEQTVRMELLYQRAADAMGVFEAQSGSLYTEQKKLGATFENMQAQLGTALLPTIVELNTQLRLLLVESTPGLTSAFKFLGEVLAGIVGLFRDAMDPTTVLGESVAALGLQFESLFKTVFGKDFDLPEFFEAAGYTLAFFLDLIHDLLYFIEKLVILFKVMGHQIDVSFTGTWEELLSLDGAKTIRDLNELNASTKAFGLESKIAAQEVKNFTAGLSEAESYSSVINDLYKIELDPHMREVLKIRDAWNETRDAANFYKITAPGASMSAGYTPGMLGTEGATDGGGGGGGGSAAKRQISGLDALIASSKKNQKVLKKELRLGGKGLSEEVAKWVTSSNTPVLAANQALKRIAKNGDKAIKNLTRNYKNSAAGQQAAAAAFAEAEANRIEQQRENERIAEELLAAEKARVEEQKRIYESFLDSVKNTFAGIKNAIMGAFDITGLGGSTNAIMRNMEKMLVRLRSFSTSVKQLATMGLDPALLQQVITMGPMAGARLASALVQGGAGALGAINASYGEFGSLASEIARTGTESSFGTDVQRNQFTINVNGGVGSGATIGKAIVDAIADYERTSGAVWTRA